MMDLAKLVNSLVLIWFCDNLNMDDRVNDFERTMNVMSSPHIPRARGLCSREGVWDIGRCPVFLHLDLRGNVNECI